MFVSLARVGCGPNPTWIRVSILPSDKCELAIDGTHLPRASIKRLHIERQLQFDLSGAITQPVNSEEKRIYFDILKRIKELDSLNAKQGFASKQKIVEAYERDQELSYLIKKSRGDKCQVCGYFFITHDGRNYCECHHLEHLSNAGLDVS
jgi:predicted HNH restriction endonuclease